jgi:predicted transcriptional regulator
MRQFGELEAVIMERLWEWGRPALVREMVDDLRPSYFDLKNPRRGL